MFVRFITRVGCLQPKSRLPGASLRHKSVKACFHYGSAAVRCAALRVASAAVVEVVPIEYAGNLCFYIAAIVAQRYEARHIANYLSLSLATRSAAQP